MMSEVAQLWQSTSEIDWNNALKRYWRFVKKENEELERALDRMDIDRVQEFTPEQWYDFLLKEYFPWKYTAPNRLVTTRTHLIRHKEERGLGELDLIRRELLQFNTDDTRLGIRIATKIPGLGVAGASGLLSLMYPSKFATVDQFVVKTLREIPNLPEQAVLNKINPEGLSERDGAILIGILQRKAAKLNMAFGTSDWNARLIDKVLWTYGR